MIDDATFTSELDRLVEGLQQKPMIAQQRAAIYDAIVRPLRVAAADWKRTVDLALASGRWPSIEQWERYVERARQQAQGPRATAERRCDCGAAFEPRLVFGWLYLGAGRQPLGADAASLDRVQHPERWVAAAEYGCVGCGVAAFLLQDEGHHEASGRRYRSGDFVVAKSARRPQAEPSVQVQAARRAHDGKPERAEAYQEARRALSFQAVRERWGMRRHAEAVLELADAFPEKAAALVAEATELVESGPRARISGSLEPPDFRPGTPTLRAAGVHACDHRRVRGREPLLCADCGAEWDEPAQAWRGGSIDSLRWPWSMEDAARWRDPALKALTEPVVVQQRSDDARTFAKPAAFCGQCGEPIGEADVVAVGWRQEPIDVRCRACGHQGRPGKPRRGGRIERRVASDASPAPPDPPPAATDREGYAARMNDSVPVGSEPPTEVENVTSEPPEALENDGVFYKEEPDVADDPF